MSKQVFSPNRTIVKQDLKKLAIGAGIALLGTLATYLEEAVPGIDFGAITPIIVAINSILVNVIRKFVISTVYVK